MEMTLTKLFSQYKEYKYIPDDKIIECINSDKITSHEVALLLDEIDRRMRA